MEMFWFIVIVIGIVGLFVLCMFLNRVKCPQCGARKCSEVSRTETGTKNISVRKKETIRHFSKEQTMAGRPKAIPPELRASVFAERTSRLRDVWFSQCCQKGGSL